MTQRIGFCCKYVVPGKKDFESVPELNNRSTTVAWLNRQTREVAEQRLWDIMVHNIQSVYNLVEKLSTLPLPLRMVRIGSDVLPVYTESSWSYYWQQPDVKNYAERHFAAVGELARKHDVRLSFHPGQFTVLASASDDIVQRSIEEFEYHVDMARWMGYGNTWHDHGFKINVHVSGRRGPQGIIDVLPRLSPEARNLITIENDENTYGLNEILQLENHVALVLDIHHHHIHSGEYICANDDRIKRIIDSWRGVRPTIHYSTSREDILVGHSITSRPDLNQLLENGYKKAKLRAHSDFMWNTALNEWAHEHWQWADVMVEAKGKNLASFKLYEFWKGLENTVSPIFEAETDTTSYS